MCCRNTKKRYYIYDNTLTYLSLIFFRASSLWGDSVGNHKGLPLHFVGTHKGLSTLKY
ncbi:hypothetical protein THIOM_005452 [Candidatus Thiomargarita nelsonii]|uniref:Uncharacterized protein n=1 Tax=Candidatus Thiomargarita nelsonii TaxID=1003181 RepID=A0A176RT85_9GAMM|nr:hypothetical protein THIOM_005452 [Candidatus Thiomargarita nelsonii]